jgi:DNA-binding transcriptional LysR family regulator
MQDIADTMTFKSGMAYQSVSLAGISIERLQTLCAVVETGSIAAAAGPDPNRQSQFSRQLKELEKALGTNLFDRVGKSLQPNEQGRRVALASQTFFASLDEVMNTALARADTIRLGAGESVLRWWIMPHLGELMAGQPPLRFELQNCRTEVALREVRTGGVDVVIVRSDSATNDLQKEVICTVRYVLAVPRTLLRSRDGAEVFEGRPLPFAELASDGLFTKIAKATAAALGLNLQSVVRAETFSLLMSAVDSGTAAAFLPEVAVKGLPEERFAHVRANGMEAMDRSLSLVWNGKVAESRASVRRALTRMRRVLGSDSAAPPPA